MLDAAHGSPSRSEEAFSVFNLCLPPQICQPNPAVISAEKQSAAKTRWMTFFYLMKCKYSENLNKSLQEKENSLEVMQLGLNMDKNISVVLLSCTATDLNHMLECRTSNL